MASLRNYSSRPVGVFDSGIGGLTVVKELTSRLPNEQIIYFGDTARVPYGSKSNDTVIEYSIQNTHFLLSKNVKAVVVACNTASSVAIPALQDRFDVPIISMIEPGSAFALSKTKTGRIGVIGTRATIGNKAYSTELLKHIPTLEVFEKACPLFVPLVEEGMIEGEPTRLIAQEYLNDFKANDIDTLILGCTHYPLLKKVISAVVGEGVTLVDSGVAAAITVAEVLEEYSLLAEVPSLKQNEFYVSDLPLQFKKIAELFLGNEITSLQKVDLEVLAAFG